MKSPALALFPLLVLASGLSPTALSEEPSRGVEQIVRSSALPKIAIRVDSALSYVGCADQVVMNGRAASEEYLFADAANGRIRRMFIVHFEHVLPGVEFKFRYPRLRMVTLGGDEYLHQSFPAEDWDLFAAKPVADLLTARGLEAPKTWLVNRYVRAVDEELRNELILFYLEPAVSLPAAAADLGLAGKDRALWEPIDRDLTRRASSVFEVLAR